MGYPSILHKIEGNEHEKKLVTDEGEMNDAYNAGFKDSPADFSPEKIAARAAKAIVDKAEAEKAAKAKERADKAEKLLAAQEKADSKKKVEPKKK